MSEQPERDYLALMIAEHIDPDAFESGTRGYIYMNERFEKRRLDAFERGVSLVRIVASVVTKAITEK